MGDKEILQQDGNGITNPKESRNVVVYHAFPKFVEVDKNEWELLKSEVNSIPPKTKWYTKFISGAYSVAGTSAASLIPYIIKIINASNHFEQLKNELITILVTVIIILISLILAEICKHAKKDKHKFEIFSQKSIQDFINMMDSKIVIGTEEEQ